MAKPKKQNQIIDKKKLQRETDHFTHPPRLEGVVKNKMLYPIRKKKRTKPEEEGKK